MVGTQYLLTTRMSTFFLAPFISIFFFHSSPQQLLHQFIPFLGVQDSGNSQSIVWELLGVLKTLSGGPWGQSFLILRSYLPPIMYSWTFQRQHDLWYHNNWMRNRYENAAIFYLLYWRFRSLSSLNLFYFEKSYFSLKMFIILTCNGLLLNFK